MKSAPNRAALKRRLDRYFWDNNSGEMLYLQHILKKHFEDFERFGRVAVIGGLIRDFAREGRSGFKSDIDLVIESPESVVADLARRLGAKANRFGGFGYRDGPWKIDFWALETTWARRYVPIDALEDIVSSTFFDWDAAVYDLWGRNLICEDDYLDRIRERCLDINLLPNPSPKGNLVRAVRRLVLWDSRPGSELEKFIDSHLDNDALVFIQEKERELFSHQVSRNWKTVEQAKNSIFEKNKKKYAEQLYLFSSK